MTTSVSVVVVGGGHAGFEAVRALRSLGFEGSVTLVDAAARHPYQRPPLSKTVLHDGDLTTIEFRDAAYYDEFSIDLILGDEVRQIRPASRQVSLATGRKIDYDHLILATGSQPRRLTAPGADLDGVVYLHQVDDSSDLRTRLEDVTDVVIVGGGFIGLEVAVAAARTGARVVVLEAQERLMARAVSPTLSLHSAQAHRLAGIEVTFGAQISALEGRDGAVTTVVLADGTRHEAQLVVVGIGATPRTDLADDAGLETQDGVVVDEMLITSDPSISAIGDCCRFPVAGGGTLRLESVQNATDQAECVAARLVGLPQAYAATPTFWSHQGDLSLKMVGLPALETEDVVRGDVAAGRFSLWRFADGRLVCVESVNRPADHALARSLLDHGAMVTPEQAADPGFNLRSVMAPQVSG